MMKKAKVIVTVYHEPVQPVAMEELPASNIHFGEMTPSHARRDRRNRRKNRNRHLAGRSPARFW